MSTVRRTVVEHNSEASERIHQLLMDLVRTAGLLHLDQAVPGQPTSLSQAFALHELDVDTPLSQRDLCERLRLEKSTVSRMVAELERKGLAVRERDPGNRRFTRLRLTDEGRSLHRGMAAAFHEQFERWISAMSRTERDGLLVGLPALVRVIRDARGDSAGGDGPPAAPARDPGGQPSL
jgi:DNA-binding MarR family transcriptional regulator